MIIKPFLSRPLLTNWCYHQRLHLQNCQRLSPQENSQLKSPILSPNHNLDNQTLHPFLCRPLPTNWNHLRIIISVFVCMKITDVLSHHCNLLKIIIQIIDGDSTRSPIELVWTVKKSILSSSRTYS